MIDQILCISPPGIEVVMGTVARITFATPDCSKARSGNAVEHSAAIQRLFERWLITMFQGEEAFVPEYVATQQRVILLAQSSFIKPVFLKNSAHNIIFEQLAQNVTGNKVSMEKDSSMKLPSVGLKAVHTMPIIWVDRNRVIIPKVMYSGPK
ncbi:hypothetical protein CNMCM5793_005734 [Aspergillus hiratsukae]|uniref:Uncharacterized protein n=1 Tax=Aspergillus hiratsukae TaxID=1194566 RepID=A0A8H6UIF0_9EURO|nr:hypothetical protein CNMCM5793_005734 [Aspergillus hiratsukae]